MLIVHSFSWCIAVGILAAHCAQHRGARRVILIDNVAYRLEHAKVGPPRCCSNDCLTQSSVISNSLPRAQPVVAAAGYCSPTACRLPRGRYYCGAQPSRQGLQKPSLHCVKILTVSRKLLADRQPDAAAAAALEEPIADSSYTLHGQYVPTWQWPVTDKLSQLEPPGRSREKGSREQVRKSHFFECNALWG